MRIFEPLDQLEQKEELLRQRVNALSVEQRKAYYQAQSKQLKDPDTYAALTWSLIGGFHHCYLGRYGLFALEMVILMICVIALIFGNSLAIIPIFLLFLFELPQLFFSQKIARQYNYDLSCRLLTAAESLSDQ